MDSNNPSAVYQVAGKPAPSTPGCESPGRWPAPARRGLRRAMWRNLLVAGLLLQAQGCFFDWEAAAESGLLALATSVSTNTVQFLLADLIPGDLELTF